MRINNRILHFCLILVIMIFGALLYYADQIPWLQNVIPQLTIQLARYSIYRILSIIPVAYAAFVFGLRGGVTTVILVSLALLPRALFYTEHLNEAVLETLAFFLIGLLVTWLIHR